MLARKYRSQGGPAGASAAGIVLANVASAMAQIVVVAVIYPPMVGSAAGPVPTTTRRWSAGRKGSAVTMSWTPL